MSDTEKNSKALKKALREADKYKGLYEVLRDDKFIGSSQKKRKSNLLQGAMMTKMTGTVEKITGMMNLTNYFYGRTYGF